jgi:hypothetical protein
MQAEPGKMHPLHAPSQCISGEDEDEEECGGGDGEIDGDRERWEQ